MVMTEMRHVIQMGATKSLLMKYIKMPQKVVKLGMKNLYRMPVKIANGTQAVHFIMLLWQWQKGPVLC